MLEKLENIVSSFFLRRACRRIDLVVSTSQLGPSQAKLEKDDALEGGYQASEDFRWIDEPSQYGYTPELCE